MPLAHVIGQQLEALALASQHLLGDKLEDRIVITVCSPVLLNLLQLLPNLLSFIASGACSQQNVTLKVTQHSVHLTVNMQTDCLASILHRH